MFKRYMLWLSAGCAIWIIAILAFTSFVDPHGLYRRESFDGVNTLRRYDPYIAKPLIASRYNFENVIFGSSIAEIGLDPTYGPLANRPAFNMGMGSATLYTIRRNLENMLRHNTPKTLLLQIDFNMKNANRRLNPSFNEAVFSTDENGRAKPAYQRYDLASLFPYVLSTNTLFKSVETILHQRLEHGGWYDGGRWEFAPSYQFAVNGGKKAHFREHEIALTTIFFTKPSYRFCASNEKYDVDAELLRILKLARAHEIKLSIVLAASHARTLELVSAVGLWDQFEQWKRNIVDAAWAQEPSKNFPVWDFSTYNKYSTELVPDDPNVDMQWYIETSHYKPVLGRIVLDRVLGGKGSDDFGIILTKENIAGHLLSQQRAREQYRRDRPSEAAAVVSHAKAAEAGRPETHTRCE